MVDLKTKWYWKWSIGALLLLVAYVAGAFRRKPIIQKDAKGTITNPKKEEDNDKGNQLESDIDDLRNG